MCNALTVHLNDEPIYDIFFANDFNSLPELLAGQGIADTFSRAASRGSRQSLRL